MKTLYLVRHAKSDKTITGISDFERPLNDRGLRDAPAMAKILAKKVNSPDLILSSPAVRALTTAQLFAEPLNYKAEKIQQCAEIYEAGVSTLLKTINEIDDRNNCVVMFGHNPGLTDLFNYLTDNDLINLPTSGIVKIDFDLDSWKLVSHGIGISTYIDYPKKV
ncbi:SixA phosphatase family protein [Solitalea canadensis]|uniref:Phosphohistidine phosphatase SixA n=1 Tax=Solitalea canadensis (strain ATCC 29591 / DSM 3403 / JCM 21819 / LMG 8368 / NBRC 15130 / NCIMB 12057 / USAM 9D) TaxID=929556 RepID=H8KUE3_SOLCM|nr:histidine phosphatase family protein [Solitalea canadensis]AFD07308.1 phosphohistidine phosphatase SixA [Solitalea canadensis DSM 3403]